MRNRIRISWPMLGTVAVAALASCLAVSGKSRSESVPEVGSSLPRGFDSREAGVCIVSPGQMDRCVQVEINGVRFTIGFRKKGWLRARRVTYVHTADPRFRSGDGRRVGDTLVIKGKADLRSAPGFEVYCGGGSAGWQPVIGFNGAVKAVVTGSSDQEIQIGKLLDSVETTVKITGFTRLGGPGR